MATSTVKTKRPSPEKQNKTKKQPEQVKTNKQKSWWRKKWTEIYHKLMGLTNKEHFFCVRHTSLIWFISLPPLYDQENLT